MGGRGRLPSPGYVSTCCNSTTTHTAKNGTFVPTKDFFVPMQYSYLKLEGLIHQARRPPCHHGTPWPSTCEWHRRLVILVVPRRRGAIAPSQAHNEFLAICKIKDHDFLAVLPIHHFPTLQTPHLVFKVLATNHGNSRRVSVSSK